MLDAAAIKATHEVRKFSGGSPLIGCRIDPTGSYVFATGQDFNITRFKLEGDEKVAFSKHDSWVRAMAFSPDGQTLITGGYDGRLVYWPATAEKPEPQQVIEDAHAGWVRAMAVSPDGKLLATCGNDHLVKLWTIDGKPVRTFTGHERHVYNVAFHPDGQDLASVDLLGVVRHWNIDSGEQVRELQAKVMNKYDPTFRADIGSARSMEFRRDGRYLACGSIIDVTNAFAGVGNAAVVLIDWEAQWPDPAAAEAEKKDGEKKEDKKAEKKPPVVYTYRPQKNQRGTMWGVAFHPDGYLLGVCGGNGGYLYFWNLDAEKEPEKAFHELKLPSDGRDLSLHADGQQLAIPFANGAVHLYKMAAKTEEPKKDAETKG